MKPFYPVFTFIIQKDSNGYYSSKYPIQKAKTIK